MSRWKNNTQLIVRYIGSGVLNTLVGFLTIFVFMAFGVSPYVSNIMGYAVGLALGYFLNRSFVFRSDGNIAKEGVRYAIAFLVSFLLNFLALRFCLTVLEITAAASQFIAAAAYTIAMYIISRRFVFFSR